MLISVIVPCYNEEQVIVETNRQLVNTLAALDDLDFEIVYVDDGSNDKTVDLLRAIQSALIRSVGIFRVDSREGLNKSPLRLRCTAYRLPHPKKTCGFSPPDSGGCLGSELVQRFPDCAVWARARTVDASANSCPTQRRSRSACTQLARRKYSRLF